jgi:hypothetical protein
MGTEVVASWDAFRARLAQYCRLSIDRRRQLIFRGQSDASWLLQTTLDRFRDFAADDERERYFATLLRRFRRELLNLQEGDGWRLEGDALELMARHHGLPTPLLDWSESPFVASYFAFGGAAGFDRNVAVWVLDRAKLPEDSSFVTIIDDETLLSHNRRAIRQRGVFLRVRTVAQPLETLLESAIFKFELPVADAPLALAELDEMTITATSLFNDMEAAARTVARREQSMR